VHETLFAERHAEREAVRMPRLFGDLVGRVVAIAIAARKAHVVEQHRAAPFALLPSRVQELELVRDGVVVVVAVDEREIRRAADLAEIRDAETYYELDGVVRHRDVQEVFGRRGVDRHELCAVRLAVREQSLGERARLRTDLEHHARAQPVDDRKDDLVEFLQTMKQEICHLVRPFERRASSG
jgi:hypothetical protein